MLLAIVMAMEIPIPGFVMRLMGNVTAFTILKDVGVKNVRTATMEIQGKQYCTMHMSRNVF